MQDIILQLTLISYCSWGALLLARYCVNWYIYLALENEDVEDHTHLVYSHIEKDVNAYVLIFFTFWWSEHDTEENLPIRRIMKVSNFLNIFFVILTVWVGFVFLYNYSHRAL